MTMTTQTPVHAVTQLVEAINRGDLEGALALYERGATLIPQPGKTARGTAELRDALLGFITMKAKLVSRTQHVVEADDVALYLGRWELRGVDPNGGDLTLGGDSTDVLRRQSDGRWLVAIDNPWGIQLLPRTGGA